MRRSQRIALITKILTENPRALFPLNYFADTFDAAKSTISEDITLIRDIFAEQGCGQVVTLAGAAGGVKYIPILIKEEVEKILAGLAQQLMEKDRILPGGYLYATDIIFNPSLANKIGEIFATVFYHTHPDYIVTMATKGIPLALATARAFNVPTVIIRDDSKIVEGSSVSINYVSGSTQRVQTMTLAKRSLKSGAKVLLIDDFMKGGGTALGMQELMQEFKAEVVGLGLLVATTEPQEKLVHEYKALLELQMINDREKQIIITPSQGLI
jgi:purine operon repressor